MSKEACGFVLRTSFFCVIISVSNAKKVFLLLFCCIFYKVKLLRTSSFSVTLHRIDCAMAKITNELVSLLSVCTIFAQNITP